jgi:hypothetical protein
VVRGLARAGRARRAARGGDEQPEWRRGWYVLAGLFAFLGTDEVVSILEKLEWNGDEHAQYYTALYLSEELLEIWGSALFAITLLTVASARGSPVVGRRERAPATAAV